MKHLFDRRQPRFRSALLLACGGWMALAGATPVMLDEVLTPAAVRAAGVMPEVWPTKVQAPEPRYPTGLASEGIDGLVIVRFVVDPAGHVSGPIEVVLASDPEFIYPATSTVRQWRFTPATLAGEPIPCVLYQPFRFKMWQDE